MKCTVIAHALRAAIACALLSPAAHAHVDYVDLSNPAVAPGGEAGATFARNGWFEGTTDTLGDSHDLAGGVFFKFHLAGTSLVDITFSDAASTGLLNPAFSLYRGLLPDEAHDDTEVDPLNPKHLVLAPPQPPSVVKDPSPVDDGATADAFGRISPFRDTANIEYVGQFAALDDWSMANDSGDWSVIEYLAHAAPGGGNTVALIGLVLGAGDYTIAAAGGTDCAGASTCLAGRIDGTVRLAVAPVPLPPAIALLAAALIGLAGRRQRCA
ncbi:MAG: hypothetical protein AB7Q97_04375 [Gammaproteobacteria bacterium]